MLVLFPKRTIHNGNIKNVITKPVDISRIYVVPYSKWKVPLVSTKFLKATIYETPTVIEQLN